MVDNFENMGSVRDLIHQKRIDGFTVSTCSIELLRIDRLRLNAFYNRYFLVEGDDIYRVVVNITFMRISFNQLLPSISGILHLA